jgi:uncharacterized protein YceK
MKKITTAIVFASISVFVLSGCAGIGKSEAYKDGVKAGETVAKASDLLNGISDVAQSLGGDDFSLSKDGKSTGCAGLWVLKGIPKYSGKDLAKQKADFLKGCESVLTP